MPHRLLLIATLILLIACWFSVGFHQGDEHFQLLEFAAWKLGLISEGQLTWEFAEQMRPATQPALVYALYKVVAVLGTVNPYYFAFLLRLLSAGLFLFVAVKIWRRFAPALVVDQRLVHWLALGLLFNWCSVYSGIRFSGENWSGMALALGFLTYPLPTPNDRESIFTTNKTGHHLACLGAGLLFGLAFLFRYQVAIMVVGFLVWLLLVGRENWQKIGLLACGGLIAVALGTVLDRWFYGEWVFAPWNYLRSNLIEGKAASFGTAPWWDYFRMVFERGVPPLSLLYLVAPIWFAWRYRRDPLTWMMVPFLVVHFYLSRKDARFLFPLLPWVPVMVVAGIKALQQHWDINWTSHTWARRSTRFLWGLNLLVLITVMFRPMISEVKVNKYLYDNYEDPVTLLADDKHIFSYADLIIHFYQRPGKVTIHYAETREAWPACLTPVCLYSHYAKVPDPPANARLVYTNRPLWADKLGLKAWLDEMKWWWIYELE